jgi:glutathione S-transferase
MIVRVHHYSRTDLPNSHALASPFTNKVRLALRLKQVAFTYVTVPSMMPRPLLKKTFGISYRKIPVLAIGRDIYCDTSLIIEALEYHFPSQTSTCYSSTASGSYGTVYPRVSGDGAGTATWDYRPLARGFASFWTDKPLFRTTTGLIPHTVWESQFGVDRAQLIGHRLDPEKLKAKVPQNLAAFDMHLSMLESLFKGNGTWIFPTDNPGLADISLYYQVKWGVDIASGRGIYNLTGGGTEDTNEDVTKNVWNEQRYPGLWRWFHQFENYMDSLPNLEVAAENADRTWKQTLKDTGSWREHSVIVLAAAPPHQSLDGQRGLKRGAMVSVVPDDTGRGDPTIGELVSIGVEEVVVEPETKGEVEVRIHFPRLGFVVKKWNGEEAKL